MFFYRLVICRLMTFLGLDEIYKERERRAIMLGKKKKPFHKPKLLMNENMKTCTFAILASINILFMLTLPLTIMKEPCEAFKKNNMPNFYAFTVTVKKYATLIDRIMILLFVALVIVGTKTVLDAIAVTKINISPWLEQGKYVLPGSTVCDHKIRNPAKERAKARARAAYYDRISEEMYKIYEESNGRCYDRNYGQMYFGNYEQTFNVTSDQTCEQTSDHTCNQTSNQASDQTSKQTSDQTYDITSDQTFNQTSDQTYEQSFDHTCDQTSDLTSDQTYDITTDQTYDGTLDLAYDMSSDQSYDQIYESASE